jgi:hypothetical protein
VLVNSSRHHPAPSDLASSGLALPPHTAAGLDRPQQVPHRPLAARAWLIQQLAQTSSHLPLWARKEFGGEHILAYSISYVHIRFTLALEVEVPCQRRVGHKRKELYRMGWNSAYYNVTAVLKQVFFKKNLRVRPLASPAAASHADARAAAMGLKAIVMPICYVM